MVHRIERLPADAGAHGTPHSGNLTLADGPAPDRLPVADLELSRREP